MKGNIKDTILRSSFELFLENGYRATTIRAIAEKSGISHTQIMYHFNSKANLAGEICCSYIQKLTDTVKHMPEDRLFTVSQNHIIAYWTIHDLILSTHRGFGSLFIEYTQDESDSFEEKLRSQYPDIYQDLFMLDVNIRSQEFENDNYVLANIDSALGRLVYLKRLKCRDAVSKFLSLDIIPGMSVHITPEDVEGFIYRNNLLNIIENFTLEYGRLS